MTKISIVIPLFNEEESISELAQWIDKVLKKITCHMRLYLLMTVVTIHHGLS